MSLYVLPVLVALIMKVAIFLFARRSGIRTRFLYAFLVAFFFHNLCELSIFVLRDQSMLVTEFVMRMYYTTSFILAGYACSCGLEVAKVRTDDFTRLIEKAVWLGAISGGVLSLITDEIVTGSTPLSYTVTAVKGSNYWVFQLNCSIAMLTAAFGLARESLTSLSPVQKTRCIQMLIAYVPMMLSSIIVMILMRYGVKVNATMVLPFTSTLFLLLLVYNERKHRITDIRRIVPGTHENKVMEELHETFANFSSGEITLLNASSHIESLLLDYSYKKNEGNVLQTANFTGLNRSTLYKKMDKHGIGPKFEKIAVSTQDQMDIENKSAKG